MIRLAAGLAAFSAAAAGAGLARALTTTYLPVLLERIRDAPGWIGTVMLVNTAAGLVVPLAVGVWSDRLRARGHTRTLPFILGGSLLTATGLAAIALGHASSYAALAVFAALAYAGMNAVTTAHRALIPETFGQRSQAAATGSEEVALLAGGLVGVVIGGLLLELEPWAPFAFGAALLPLLALPTVVRRRDLAAGETTTASGRAGLSLYRRALVRPGTRLVLAAQVLWVGGYVGLTPFFVLFAEREVGLRPSVAALVLGGFGAVAGLTMLGASRIPARLWPTALVAAAAAMAAGLALAAPATSAGRLAVPLALGAVGFGALTTLGFSLYARWIPRGEEGGYTALYLSARAAAALVALPLTGWTIAATDTYRAALAVGAAAAALALVPLLVLALGTRRVLRVLAALGAAALATAAVFALGLLVAETVLADADARLVDALLGLGGTPLVVDTLLVDPHIENYVALTLVAAVAAALRGAGVFRTTVFVAAAGALSFAAVRTIWALWDRPRPQEVLGDVGANEHDWSPHASFPSGHVAVTVALAVAASRAVPALSVPLALYAAAISLTRVTYGAHFPSDVAGAALLGVLGAVLAAVLLRELGLPIPWFGELDRRRLRRAATWAADRRKLVAVARIWSVAAAVLFVVLLATIGPPHGPEGGVLPSGTEHSLNQALLELVVAAAALAWLWHAAGGAAMLVLAVAIGAFARIEYSPEAGLLVCLAFFVPALLYLLASRRVTTPRARSVVAVAAVGLLALGGVAGARVHAAAFGPSHPESPLEPLPASAVEWLWAGAVTPTSVRVNAKLEADGAARLLVGRTRSLAGAVASAPRRAEEDVNDRTVSLSVRGLVPNRRYFYAVEVDGVADLTRRGTFRTFPRGPGSFTVAVGSCARTGSNGAVFDAIRAERPLLFLVAGDLFYGNIDEPSARRFRAAYGATLTAPAQAALYRSAPVAYVWDDHDYGPNDGDASSPSRETAQQAYREAVPHYPLAAGSTGPVHQAFTVGRVRFLLTDSRSERVPGRTMLGEAQKRWLVRELALADRRGQLAVWVSSVPWIAGREAGDDTWAGFPQERRELADAVRGPVLMLAGDAHMVAIDDGSHSDYSSRGGAGFPLMHAAALDRPGGTKGGPYSEGAVGGSGQFATVRVEDDGSGPVRVTLAGRRHDGTVLLRYAYSVELRPAVP